MTLFKLAMHQKEIEQLKFLTYGSTHTYTQIIRGCIQKVNVAALRQPLQQYMGPDEDRLYWLTVTLDVASIKQLVEWANWLEDRTVAYFSLSNLIRVAIGIVYETETKNVE